MSTKRYRMAGLTLLAIAVSFSIPARASFDDWKEQTKKAAVQGYEKTKEVTVKVVGKVKQTYKTGNELVDTGVKLTNDALKFDAYYDRFKSAGLMVKVFGFTAASAMAIFFLTALFVSMRVPFFRENLMMTLGRLGTSLGIFFSSYALARGIVFIWDCYWDCDSMWYLGILLILPLLAYKNWFLELLKLIRKGEWERVQDFLTSETLSEFSPAPLVPAPAGGGGVTVIPAGGASPDKPAGPVFTICPRCGQAAYIKDKCRKCLYRHNFTSSGRPRPRVF